MLFNSFEYFIFLPVVVVFYYLLAPKYRWLLLLLSSCYFYMYFIPVYILILAFTIVIDYYAGIFIEEAPLSKKKTYLYISIAANLGVLSVFKYYNFFIGNFESLLSVLQINHTPIPYLNIILPVGLSFHTFQAMSYTMEVYKGKHKAERNFGLYSLYVMFFPQLVAGPIEKPQALFPQFHFNFEFNQRNLTLGLRLILLGLFKKIVIADQLNTLVSYVFDNPSNHTGITMYLAFILFAQQIYCDFSGYSDIARGSARLLGIDLMQNFNTPFFTKSLNIFWGQWHISLMNWFKEYIMFPLIKKKWNWMLVFMIVFAVSGLWHGANWTFIVWGVYNGIFVIYSKLTSDFRKNLIQKTFIAKHEKLRYFIQIICVYHISTFSSIFFRTKNIHDAYLMITKMFLGLQNSIQNAIHNVNNSRQDILYFGKDFISVAVILSFLVLFVVFEYKIRNSSLDELLNKLSTPKKYALYLFGVFSIIVMSNIPESPFVYFQF